MVFNVLVQSFSCSIYRNNTAISVLKGRQHHDCRRGVNHINWCCDNAKSCVCL